MTKLLTEDLPRIFVRQKKIVLDFQKGKAVGPVPNDVKPGEMQEGNKDFTGELSVTLVDARNLSYAFYGNNYFSVSKEDSIFLYELVKSNLLYSINYIAHPVNLFLVW